ncbi:MAG: hypothetical protein ACM3QY_01580 [Candidatus Levyibacteriota bacterium]
MLANRLSGWLRPLLTLAALAGVLSLAACGGGGGAPNNPYQPGGGAVTVTPATGSGYSGTPFVFTISGGTAPYTMTSGNAALLPVPSTISGGDLVVVPGIVATATPVSFTVTDVLGRQAAGSLTINPAFLTPITVTGNASCKATGATLCPGADGTASVTVAGPGGAPLPGHQVRFDVVQGNFSLSAPGGALVQSLTVTPDTTGKATVRLVVPATAVTQIASIRATDTVNGSNVLGQFTIASTALSVIPSGTTTFTGPDTTHCAAGAQATFYIFGGTPPYSVGVTFPSVVGLSGAPVQSSGGGFTITSNGTCFTGLTFAITDATGTTLATPPTVDNVFGTAPASTVLPLVVTPNQNDGTATSRISCAGTLGFTITGNPPFSAVASDPAVVLSGGGVVTTSPGTLSASNFTPGSTVTVTVGDANTPQQLQSKTIYCQ